MWLLSCTYVGFDLHMVHIKKVYRYTVEWISFGGSKGGFQFNTDIDINPTTRPESGDGGGYETICKWIGLMGLRTRYIL